MSDERRKTDPVGAAPVVVAIPESPRRRSHPELPVRGFGMHARAQKAQPTDLVQLAAFTVGEERYALDIMRIKEIINPLPITRVPRAPVFIEGVIELRGAILPVVDLRKRFDAPAGPQTRLTKYVIVAVEGLGERWIVGLIVDKVLEVIRIPREELRPAPAMTFGDSARYFTGVCRHRERIVMVLDLDAILSSSERISLAGLADSPLLPSMPSPAAGGGRGTGRDDSTRER